MFYGGSKFCSSLYHALHLQELVSSPLLSWRKLEWLIGQRKVNQRLVKKIHRMKRVNSPKKMVNWLMGVAYGTSLTKMQIKTRTQMIARTGPSWNLNMYLWTCMQSCLYMWDWLVTITIYGYSMSRSPASSHKRSPSASPKPSPKCSAEPRWRKSPQLGSINKSPAKVSNRQKDTSSNSQMRSPAHKAPVQSASNRGQSLSKSPPDGASQRIRKGRGFSERYSYVRRYRTPSPERLPARSHRYGGRNFQDGDRDR